MLELLMSAKFYTNDSYRHLKTTLLIVDCLSSDAQIRTCFVKRKLLMLKVKKKIIFCPGEFYVKVMKTELSGRRDLD